MSTPSEFDPPADDLEELDLSEGEFDALLAGGEPVIVIGLGYQAHARQHLEEYYTVQMSDSRLVAASAGLWGGGRSLADPTPVPSPA